MGCSKLFTSWFLETRLPGWLSYWDMLPLLTNPLIVPASQQEQASHSYTGSFLELPPELLEQLWSSGWKISIALCNFPSLLMTHAASRNASQAVSDRTNPRSMWTALLHLELGVTCSERRNRLGVWLGVSMLLDFC